MKQQELDLILDNHKKWLNNEDGGSCAELHGADLRGAELYGANLRGAELYGANLRGADLRRADLRDADLRRADLRDADLRRADLRDAELYGANLRGADLSCADLRRADLRDAELYGANLRGADLWSTTGNQKQIVTLQTDVWQIVYTAEVMQIGCQRHSIKDWLSFSDERISRMDGSALDFWKKWKPILLLILEVKPD